MLKDLTKEELLLLLYHYDRYIQEANDDGRYSEGFSPVCISEFYDNELQEYIRKVELEDERREKEKWMKYLIRFIKMYAKEEGKHPLDGEWLLEVFGLTFEELVELGKVSRFS